MSQAEEYSWDKYTASGSTSQVPHHRVSGAPWRYQGGVAGCHLRYQSEQNLYSERIHSCQTMARGCLHYTDYFDTSRALNTATGVGIQRGTFGPFLVRTDSTKELGFYSFLESDSSPDVTFGKFYSTLDIAPAEFMGSH